jgi:hypothetical protein
MRSRMIVIYSTVCFFLSHNCDSHSSTCAMRCEMLPAASKTGHVNLASCSWYHACCCSRKASSRRVPSAYATQIARDWNVKASGAGFVTRFAVNAAHLAHFPKQTVGGSMHSEYWIPAGKFAEFNANIVGLIEVVEAFHGNLDT